VRRGRPRGPFQNSPLCANRRWQPVPSYQVFGRDYQSTDLRSYPYSWPFGASLVLAGDRHTPCMSQAPRRCQPDRVSGQKGVSTRLRPQSRTREPQNLGDPVFVGETGPSCRACRAPHSDQGTSIRGSGSLPVARAGLGGRASPRSRMLVNEDHEQCAAPMGPEETGLRRYLPSPAPKTIAMTPHCANEINFLTAIIKLARPEPSHLTGNPHQGD
jgi:hypothetical protein